MILAVASGKGGTGKTTVAASLASVWDRPLLAVDLDVEEPNLHIFLKPEFSAERTASLEVPEVDEEACVGCRACVELCQFKALSLMGDMLLVFQEMCHGCGGCFAVCPAMALKPASRELGKVLEGRAGALHFLMGRLRVGEAMSPPLMRVVRQRMAALLADGAVADAIIDAPPGVSCPAVSAVLDSDAIVLVTEPTPFGFHDFALAWEAFTPLNKPMAAVINRCDIGDRSVENFCKDKGLPVLARIPFDRAIAAGYSRGAVPGTLSPGLRATFTALRDAVREHLLLEVGHA